MPFDRKRDPAGSTSSPSERITPEGLEQYRRRAHDLRSAAVAALLAQLFQAPGHLLATLLQRLHCRRMGRAARRQIAAFDDRTPEDIGLHRADVGGAVDLMLLRGDCGGAQQQPTAPRRLRLTRRLRRGGR